MILLDISYEPDKNIKLVRRVTLPPCANVASNQMKTLLFCSLAILALAGSGLGQQPNSVDHTFNSSVTAPGAGINAVVVQPNGEVLIGGGNLTYVNGNLHLSVARINPDGTVDAGFSAQADGEVEAIALQGDSKVLIGGYFSHVNGVARNAVARLNVDGTLDATFDPQSGPGKSAGNFPMPVNIKSIAVQPDGKILIGGDFGSFNNVTRTSSARLNADGSVDGSFNPVSTGLNTAATIRSVVAQRDGKVILGGSFASVNGSAFNGIVRLNSDGSTDTAFKSTSDGSFTEIATAVVQSDGKIVFGGNFGSINHTRRRALARLNADGSLDSAFAPSSINESAVTASINALVLQPDGKLIAGGAFSTKADATLNNLARFNTDGTLDTSFDANIRAVNVLSGVSAVALQADGHVLVGGEFDRVNGALQPGVARLTSGGQFDAAFQPRLEGSGFVNQLITLSDNKLLLGGSFSSVNGVARTALARLNPDGSLDGGFNAALDRFVPGADGSFSVLSCAEQSDGKILFFGVGNGASVTTPIRQFGRLNADGSTESGFQATVGGGEISTIRPQPDGSILIGGSFQTVNGTANSYLARLNANGSSDNTFPVLRLKPITTGNNVTVGPRVDFIERQADQKILVAGAFGSVNDAPHADIVRLNADGTVDSSFTANVEIRNQTFSAPTISSLVLQSDGKIVIGGSFDTVDGVSRNGAARLNPGGSLDTTFDVGLQTVPQSGGVALVNALVMQKNGRFLMELSGLLSPSPAELIRVNHDGTADSSFTPVNPKTNIDSAINVSPLVFTLQNDGKIVLGGFFATVEGEAHVGTARLIGDPVAPSQLLNIATRMRVLDNDNVLIGGFILTGNAPKKVLLRAIGPSLTSFGVTEALADPTLELHKPDGTVVTNDNWKINDATGQSQEAEIRATTIPPSNDLESAILATLPPGAYTAIVSGKSGGTGIGLVEAYDLDQSAVAQFGNIATRGFVDTGNNVMIGGFILGPSNAGNSKVVVRGIGPSLTAAGVPGALQDPTLELHDGNGVKIAFNDNWQDDAGAAEVKANQLDPKDPRESALLRVLPPGAYSAIVAGSGNTTGVGLVEVYSLQ